MNKAKKLLEEPNKADFFSVMLQDTMAQSLRESLTFGVKTFLSKYFPLGLSNISAQNLAMILDLFINAITLCFSQACFAEFFYKLKRHSYSKNGASKFKVSRLKFRVLILHFAKNFIFKKLKNKIQNFLDNENNLIRSENNISNRSSRNKIRFVKLINFLLKAFEFINILFKIKYF